MLRALCVVAVVMLAGCKKDKPNPDQEFWNWVRAHTAELKAVKTGHEPVVEALSGELEKVAPGLTFELGGADPFEFIISADGIIERFPAVTRLTAAAGEVPGIKVFAFRQRKAIDGFSVQFDGLKIDASSVLFISEKDDAPEKLALDLYVDGYNEKTEAEAKQGVFVLLDTAIGEFDMETKVGAIEFHPWPAPKGAKPMSALAPEIDALKK